MAGIVDVIGGISKGIASIFDNGFDIYGSVKERIIATDRIGEDTVNPTTTNATIDQGNLLEKASKALSSVSVGLTVAGILGVILVFLIIKRKRG